MNDTNELSVTRFIAAKPDKVWQVMTARRNGGVPSPGTPRSTRKTAARWASAT